jgi:hypothetical protein
MFLLQPYVTRTHHPAPHFISENNKNMHNFSSRESATPNAIFVIRKRGSGRWINKLDRVSFSKRERFCDLARGSFELGN